MQCFELKLEGKFSVDPTPIATDIQVPNAGKHLGTKRILDWLKANSKVPKHFIAVGDSVSDLEMADELKAQGKSYEFIYVNPAKALDEKRTMVDNKPKYNLKVSSAPYSKGLVEIFQSLQNAA